jgi:hypothetical protein
MAESLGCCGEYVERPYEIRPALDRAQREVDRGSVALVQRQDRLPRARRHGGILPIYHLSIAGAR